MIGKTHAAYRLTRQGIRFRLDMQRLILLVEHPGLFDFGEVVIFGGKPKYGDRGNPLVAQFFRGPNGRQHLVDRENGSAMKSHLLSGCHHHCVLLGQAIEIRGGFGSGGSVLISECHDQCGAVLGGDFHLGGGVRELV